MRRSTRTVFYFICGCLPFVPSAAGEEVVFSFPRGDEGTQVAIEARVPADERAVVQIAANSAVDNPVPSMPSAQPPTADARPMSPSFERSVDDHHAYAAHASMGNGYDSLRLLRYMRCDPYSCPNIWDGYQSQREAELARKCAAGGCGRGLGCGCSQAGQSAGCGVCSSSGSVPLNRYRLPSACDEIPTTVSLSATPHLPGAVDATSARLSASPRPALPTPAR
jgi:hypothetical protein